MKKGFAGVIGGALESQSLFGNIYSMEVRDEMANGVMRMHLRYRRRLRMGSVCVGSVSMQNIG